MMALSGLTCSVKGSTFQKYRLSLFLMRIKKAFYVQSDRSFKRWDELLEMKTGKSLCMRIKLHNRCKSRSMKRIDVVTFNKLSMKSTILHRRRLRKKCEMSYGQRLLSKTKKNIKHKRRA